MARNLSLGALVSAAVLAGAIILYLLAPFGGTLDEHESNELLLDNRVFELAKQNQRSVLLFCDCFCGIPFTLLYDSAWFDELVLGEYSTTYVPAVVNPSSHPLLVRALNADEIPAIFELSGEGEVLSATSLLEVYGGGGVTDVKGTSIPLRTAKSLAGEADSGVELSAGGLVEKLAGFYGSLGHRVLESASRVDHLATTAPVWFVSVSLVLPDRSSDGRFKTFAERYLRAASSPHHNQRDGGLHHAFSSSHWEAPVPAKTLRANAILLSGISRASMATGDDRYGDYLRSTARFISGVLYDRKAQAFSYAYWSGGLDSNLKQHLDLDGLDRKPVTKLRKEEEILRVFATYPNALAISAFVSAYQATSDTAYLHLAETVFNTFESRTYEQDSGFAHAIGDEGERRYLIDQVSFIAASLDLFEATGKSKYLEFAEQVRRIVTRTYSDLKRLPVPVVWKDSPSRIPLPEHDIEALSIYALSLERMSHLTGDHRLHDLSSGMLEGMIDLRARNLDEVAVYAAAIRYATRYPLSMYVIGERTDTRTQELLRAACKVFAPERVIALLDPAEDSALIDKLGLAYLGEPSVFACIGDMCSLPITEPADVGNIRNMLGLSFQ
jgi:hypothetical protein